MKKTYVRRDCHKTKIYHIQSINQYQLIRNDRNSIDLRVLNDR
jgi:hypothetical protein